MKKFTFLFAFLVSVFLITSCSTQNKINKINIASNYVDDYPGGFMQQQVFHINDSISELAVKIDPVKIPGLKNKQVDVYSLMTLNYAVYSSMDKKDLVQSDIYKVSDLVPYDQLQNGGAVVKIPLHLQENRSYIILLSVKDQVNKRDFLKVLRITKNESAPENYKIINENNELLWHTWIEKEQQIKIVYRYPQTQKLYISYFKPKFSPAKPPFTENQKGEYVTPKNFEKFEVELSNGVSQLVQLPKEGVYKIHSKADIIQGKLLVQFYSSYPHIKNDAQKVFALRYLNGRKEFSMMLKDDPAHTVKEFWFFDDRTKERSQEMMKTYYARTQRANALFSSYKEGWKTDRGMIFMIYGPPDQVYSEAKKEVWEYGAEADYNDLRFEFYITNTPLNHQEYILYHQDEFKTSWYTVLENWRNK